MQNFIERRRWLRKVQLPTEHDFSRARVAVRQHLSPTRLMPLPGNLWLKLESRQPVGAFKVRGAVAAVSRLPAGSRVVTASAGNHAIGVAWAAIKLGQQATIVVPGNVSTRKLEILQEMDAEVVQIGTSFDDAEAHALQLAESGITYISAYNDPHVIAGQATVLEELLSEIEGDFTVIVPVGGGGLIAGVAARAAKVTDRTISVVGVEAEASQAVSASVAAGKVIDVPIGETLADGLAGNLEPDSITVDILKQYPPTFSTVTEAQIRAAIRELYADHDLVAEGAAATSYAAMKSLEIDGPVVALITGRNIERDTLEAVITGKD